MTTPPVTDTAKQQSLMDEVETLLEGGFEYVEILSTDLAGNTFGKRYPAAELREFAIKGLSFPRAMYAQNIVAEAQDDYTGYGGEDGDPDIPVRLIPGSMGYVTWGDRPRAQALVTSVAPEDVPDPRRALETVLKQYDAANLKPVAAFELEFTLFDNERTQSGGVAEARNPITGARETSGMLSVDRLDGFEPFLHEVVENCKTQGVDTTSLCSEFAPGQFEINFPHYDDALAAADKAHLFRRTVRAIARKHGFIATFMAKPELERPSSGQHIHISVLDGNGNNIFNGGDKPTDALMHAIGGLQAGAKEAMLCWAPNLNSYRRFAAGSCTPTGPTWAFDHRHIAFRIPLATGNAWRIENRVPGADANSYLAIAATLASMLVGIQNKMQPTAETHGTPDLDHDNMPFSARAAIAAARSGSVIKPVMGEDFMNLYASHREGELDMFEDFITSRELDWYL